MIEYKNRADLIAALICAFEQFRSLIFRLKEFQVNPLQVDPNVIKPGDHIFYYTYNRIYSHHGIYCGEGMVVHFITDIEKYYFGSKSKSQCCVQRKFKPESLVTCCGFRLHGSGVVSSCLDCFSEKRPLYRYDYGVGTLSFLARLRGGTCTMAKSDSPEEGIRRANHLLQKGVKPYNQLLRNCEDFALYCKTSLVVRHDREVAKASGRVHTYIAAVITVIVLQQVIQLINNRVVTMVVAVGIYLFTTRVIGYGCSRGGDVKVQAKKFMKKIFD